MWFRSNSQWQAMYVEWRKPFAHLTPERRGFLVRGCRKKAIYDSQAEAEQVILRVPKPNERYLHWYLCPLCGGFHVGDRRRA
jgi:hypothetical protein